MHRPTTLALCTELGLLAAGDAPGVPGAIPLIPAGPTVRGRDGREWTFDQPSIDAVLQAFEARGVELPIDWEHATQHRAPRGEAAPAAGWIKAINTRNGALWADVQWTDRGHDQVLKREYRYISPVFDFDPSTGRIVRLVSAGLTNTPNLPLQALNQEQPMKLSLTAALAAALGVSVDADEAVALSAIEQLKTAMNREANNLERYVPRGDYDQALIRATNAEQRLEQITTDQHAAAVTAALDSALKTRKIAPTSVEYHRAMCSDQAGLERFRAFVGAAPVIAPDSGLDQGKPPAGTALNAEEAAVCTALGVSEADYIAERTARAAG
jgi:phage I-like protein